jgi:hypothetical protein
MTNIAVVLVGDLLSWGENTVELKYVNYGFVNLRKRDARDPNREPSLDGGCLSTEGLTLVTVH